MTRQIRAIGVLAVMLTIGMACPKSQAIIVAIDFDDVAPFQNFLTYSEDGFTLTPNVGWVLINDAFSPGNNAAQPSFGFGQGMDSSFTFTNDNKLYIQREWGNLFVFLLR